MNAAQQKAKPPRPQLVFDVLGTSWVTPHMVRVTLGGPAFASAPTTVDVTLASRYFERFADHGVSVARKVTYLVTGEWQPSAPLN